ncbi:MAG: hypothetical protein ACOC4G_08165 [Bacillota bacterium]
MRKVYQAKSYNECGYNFTEGNYKIKAEMEEFPKKIINHEDELKIAKQQWLEGLDKKDYERRYDGVWYYIKFPEKDHYEWIPENVAEEVFN